MTRLSHRSDQTGSVLIIALIFLTLITVGALTAVQNQLQSEDMAANAQTSYVAQDLTYSELWDQINFIQTGPTNDVLVASAQVTNPTSPSLTSACTLAPVIATARIRMNAVASAATDAQADAAALDRATLPNAELCFVRTTTDCGAGQGANKLKCEVLEIDYAGRLSNDARSSQGMGFSTLPH